LISDLPLNAETVRRLATTREHAGTLPDVNSGGEGKGEMGGVEDSTGNGEEVGEEELAGGPVNRRHKDIGDGIRDQ